MASMTTPRDDIDGLSERLRYISLVMFSAHEKNIPMSVWEKDPVMVAEAATAIDALQERVKELEGEVEAFQRHEQTLRDNGIASHSEAVVRVVDAESRALRAEKERDEAVDLLRKMTDPSIDDALYPFAECFDSVRDFIRRLAEPEKEKKE